MDEKTLKDLLKLCFESKKNGADMMIDIMPHCNGVNIRVFKTGWKSGQWPNLNRTIYFDHGDHEKELRKIRSYLERYKLVKKARSE